MPSEVLFKEGYQDPTVMTRTILSGSADVERQLAAAAGRAQVDPRKLVGACKQLPLTPTGGSRYVALNTSKTAVRQPRRPAGGRIVLDRNAMRLTRGGVIDGRIATHFLDPTSRARASRRRAASRSTVPEPRLPGKPREGQGRWWARAATPSGIFKRPAGDDGGRQLAAGVEPRAGRHRRPGQDRLQGQDDLGHALDDVHGVLQRPEERAEHLPDFGWLRTSTAQTHARRHVRREQDHAGRTTRTGRS